jgi:hypothetical protein
VTFRPTANTKSVPNLARMSFTSVTARGYCGLLQLWTCYREMLCSYYSVCLVYGRGSVPNKAMSDSSKVWSCFTRSKLTLSPVYGKHYVLRIASIFTAPAAPYSLYKMVPLDILSRVNPINILGSYFENHFHTIFFSFYVSHIKFWEELAMSILLSKHFIK